MKKYIKPITTTENVELDNLMVEALSATGSVNANQDFEALGKERDDYDDRTGWTDGLW